MTNDIEAKIETLLAQITSLGSCAVAFSGGVDSAVIAAAAFRAIGESAVAVTADSPSLPTGELEAARELAAHIGIQHRIISTAELNSTAYRANAPDRCYHCKSELYQRMSVFIQDGFAYVLNGTNADDLQDYRPGLTAATEHQVVSPLADCGITKVEVREIARQWHLPVWDKPAGPCLSSRVAYGEEVTPEKLEMIDRAEAWLRNQGYSQVRVRYHAGALARAEVPIEQIESLFQQRQELSSELRRFGFRFVTIDTEGFRSGSLNNVVSLDLDFRSVE